MAGNTTSTVSFVFEDGDETYIQDLETLRAFAEANAAELIEARAGAASLYLKLQAYMPYGGWNQNVSAGGYRITNGANAQDPQDFVTLSQAQAISSGGGSPANIPVTALNVGTATAGQYLRITLAGDGIEGFTPTPPSRLKARILYGG